MMFDRASGVPLKSIPYRGGAPLLQDLLGGQISAAFNVIREALRHAKACACDRPPVVRLDRHEQRLPGHDQFNLLEKHLTPRVLALNRAFRVRNG